jgi:hypothetical protein
MPTLPTPFPLPPPHCTLLVVYERLLATLRGRSKPEQEALFQAIGRMIAAEHEVMMFDADYRAWSEAHRISPQLEYAIQCHLTESESFLQ